MDVTIYFRSFLPLGVTRVQLADIGALDPSRHQDLAVSIDARGERRILIEPGLERDPVPCSGVR
jgi:hypothetical protein